ncbi:biliverdin-producing heme oxygenase [Pacificibacter marinus]|uniref:Heme oxygenase n=1 Tax=Pacificibacter marinus TaxID=658057 RepID=A0A1Y5RIE7_9RHOB|nr:biliverdin-producing heme oxygenase [Pacificibacter marinus]SEK22132.1 heme oxygenase [Pacificibacter marinus]SLN15568.1 Heme oxygenase [Pacificibacter marinus]
MNTTLQTQILFSDRLRAATQSTHETLDQSIMAAKPFENLTTYGQFLRVQHGIHRDVEPLYRSADLAKIFDNLQGRARLGAVEQDLADLGIHPPDETNAPATTMLAQRDMAQALGWLYVIEGSNIGAAFLLKYAKKMGLSETYGARHMAEPPEGRAPYWRSVKQTLNSVALTQADEARAVAAAETAFNRVRQLVQRHLG